MRVRRRARRLSRSTSSPTRSDRRRGQVDRRARARPSIGGPSPASTGATKTSEPVDEPVRRGTTPRSSDRPRAGATGPLRGERCELVVERPAAELELGARREAARGRTRAAAAGGSRRRPARRAAAHRRGRCPSPRRRHPTAARSSWTRRRDSSPVTQRRPGTTTRPSSETASLRSRRPAFRDAHVRHASFCARASGRSSSSTSTPAASSATAPPPASGLGSAQPATTRATPAATIASTHGGVRPWCAQGSMVTKSVAPRARSPAASRATISACRPPAGSVTPSPTTVPSAATTTAPTVGFGYAVPARRRGELERALEAHAAAAASRRYASAGSASAKTALPATSSEAPASRTTRGVLLADAAVDLDRHVDQRRELARCDRSASGMKSCPE